MGLSWEVRGGSGHVDPWGFIALNHDVTESGDQSVDQAGPLSVSSYHLCPIGLQTFESFVSVFFHFAFCACIRGLWSQDFWRDFGRCFSFCFS